MVVLLLQSCHDALEDGPSQVVTKGDAFVGLADDGLIKVGEDELDLIMKDR